MPAHSIVQDLVLLYALALVFLVAGGRLGVPAIVSLIVTGVVAGPGGLAIVGSAETVGILSEVGIALMLFMVGLDLPFGALAGLWRNVAVAGSAQVVATMAAAVPLAALLVTPRPDTLLFVGLYVALSSTSILVRELTRRNEMHAPHGSLAIGVLLFQDLVALAALVLAPAAFGTVDGSVGRALLQIVLMVVAFTAVTRFVLPVLFRLATASGREAFGLMVVVASVGTAYLASVLGLSMTVGAFLAGLVIDESAFSHQIHAEIRPLRDLLTSLFFVSVGLLVHPAELLPVWWLVLAVAAGLVVLKALAAFAALGAARVPVRVAATAALGLAQIGEFSFVLGREAVAGGAIGPDAWQVLLGGGVLTMMATPALVAAAPRVGSWVAARAGGMREPATAAVTPAGGHVVILGFGVGGRLIARALQAVGTPHVILEISGATVREAALGGQRIHYGDATAEDALEAAGVPAASAVVAVLSDPGASERAVRAVRALNPRVPLIVRTRYRAEAERVVRAGATVAVVEELEASLEVAAQLLSRLGLPGNRAEALVDEARRAWSAPATRPSAVPASADQVAGALGEMPVTSHALGAGAWAVGRDLADLDLRARTGATVLAVRRGPSTVAPPPVGWRFAAGDVLYLAGDSPSLRRARAHRNVVPRRSRLPLAFETGLRRGHEVACLVDISAREFAKTV